MLEWADNPDLGSGAERRAGSSPVSRTYITIGNSKETNNHILVHMGQNTFMENSVGIGKI